MFASSSENLTISIAKKKVITALVKTHISRASDDVFDDFVERKKQSLFTLLQYEVQRFDRLPRTDIEDLMGSLKLAKPYLQKSCSSKYLKED